MNVRTKRQVIIVAGFCLPLFAIIILAHSTSPEIANFPANRASGIPQTPDQMPVIPPSTLEQERARIKGLMDEVNAMTPEEYLEKKKNDPSLLAPTLGIRKQRIAKRYAQLERMTQEQWDAEELRKASMLPNPVPRKAVLPSAQTMIPTASPSSEQ